MAYEMNPVNIEQSSDGVFIRRLGSALLDVYLSNLDSSFSIEGYELIEPTCSTVIHFV